MLNKRCHDNEESERLIGLVGTQNLMVEDMTWCIKEATRFKSGPNRVFQEFEKVSIVEFKDPNYLEELNSTLRAAAESGQVNNVKELVEKFGLDVNLKASSDGKSLLHLATSNNFPAMATLLLSLGATFQIDSSGATPLHLAARHRDAEVFRTLLKAFMGVAEIDSKDNHGLLALHVAACYGNILAIYILRECGSILEEHFHDRTKDGRTLLLCAAESGSLEVIDFLVNSTDPASLSEVSYDGSTALHYSAQSLSSMTTRYFLQHGIEVDIQRSDKSTALHTVAAIKPSSEGKRLILEMLLNSKANINAQRADGKSALHILCDLGDWSEHCSADIGLLIDRGAIIDITDSDACTPLHRLIYHYMSRISGRVDSDIYLDAFVLKTVRGLLEQDSDCSSKDHKGASPLSLVLETWISYRKESRRNRRLFTDILRLMLDHIRNEVLHDHEFAASQPLTLALKSRDEKLAERLLRLSCDVDRRDLEDEQYNAMEQACYTGCSPALLTQLIQRSKKNLTTQQTHNGFNLLHIAVRAGNSNLIEALVEHGLKIDDPETYQSGRTALMEAAARSNYEMVQVLLRWKANTKAVNSSGWTALHYAASRGSLEIAKLVRPDALPKQRKVTFRFGLNINGINPLHLAASRGNCGLVDYLLEAYEDLDVNSVADSRVSALHIAALTGKTFLVEHLISIGAKLDAIDDFGRPLHYALLQGHNECASILLDHGAGLNIRDNRGMSPEFLALENGHIDTAKILSRYQDKLTVMLASELSAHSLSNDPQSKDSPQVFSLTEAVFHAISRKDITFCEKLIDAGANVNGLAPDCGRCTPLLAALKSRRIEIAELLIC